MILRQVNGDKIVQHIDKEQNNMSVAENVAIKRCELFSDPFCCTSNTQQNSIHFLYKRQLSASDIH